MNQQTSSGAADGLNESALGYWAVSVDGQARCHIALNRLPADGGRGVYSEGCDKDLAATTAWRSVGANIELIDQAGDVIVRLTQASLDAWQGQDAQGREIRLTLAPMS